MFLACIRFPHVQSGATGDEISGFVEFRNPFRYFNRHITDMKLYSWCFLSAACLDLSVQLAIVRLMPVGATPTNRCRLSI